MKTFQCSPCTVLLCWMLNISGFLAGWPDVICININNFFWNSVTHVMYDLISCQFTSDSVSDFKNLLLTVSFCSTWLNNHIWSSINNCVQWFCKKFYSDCLSVELSLNNCHEIFITLWVCLLLNNNKFFINNCWLFIINLWRMLWNWAMLNCTLLYNNLLYFFYLTWPLNVML